MGLGFDMLNLELAVDVATHCITGRRVILVIHVGGGAGALFFEECLIRLPNCACKAPVPVEAEGDPLYVRGSDLGRTMRVTAVE